MLFLKSLIVCVSLTSLYALANPEVEKLVQDYKQAMNSHDKEKVKALTTDEFYKSLTNNDLLDRLFKKTKKVKKKYEVEVVESKVVKDGIMASASEKGSDHDHKHKDWYKIKKSDGKYLIDQEVHLD